MSKPNLYEQWSSEEVPYKDTDLAKKTFSYRFPVHIAARLAAIEEMFPGKNRTEVIIGVLKLGLAQFEESLPVEEKKRRITKEEAEEFAYSSGEDIEKFLGSSVPDGKIGPRVDFIKKANAHFVALEKERGIKAPAKDVFKV